MEYYGRDERRSYNGRDKGFTAMTETSDAMAKAYKVRLIGYEKIGSGYVTTLCVGEVKAVRSAVEAGAASAQKVGERVGIHLIPRPHEDLEKYLSRISVKVV
ncbi:MAG: BMC domain-containing protein [Elusimicrobiota bacterium]